MGFSNVLDANYEKHFSNDENEQDIAHKFPNSKKLNNKLSFNYGPFLTYLPKEIKQVSYALFLSFVELIISESSIVCVVCYVSFVAVEFLMLRS